MKKLFAAGALALACLFVTSAAVTAVGLSPDPVVTVDGLHFDACTPVAPDLDCLAPTAQVLPADPVCTLSTKRFTLASLHAPASIYDLPIYVRIDPGRVT